MRVSLLCRDLSSNAFGRAYILARVLAQDYEVQVVGPQFGPSLWLPMAGLLESNNIPIVAERAVNHYPNYLSTFKRLWQLIDADVVYALKPYPTSFGLGLLYHQRQNIPLILDIDDWELGNYRAMKRSDLVRSTLMNALVPNNYLWLRLLYQQTRRANEITVSSQELKRRFGGTIIPHGRDTTSMDPSLYDRDAARKTWQVTGRVVLFLGTVRPHKGVEDLLSAVERLHYPDMQCIIAGVNDADPYVTGLRQQASSQIRFIPMLPFETIPSLLQAADVVVIPQRDTAFSKAQVPAKIFDAMAMGRPIISTSVSDIPNILRECGLIVPPNDVSALTGALREMLGNPQLARDMGMAARAKCVQKYSWAAMRALLLDVIRRVHVA